MPLPLIALAGVGGSLAGASLLRAYQRYWSKTPSSQKPPDQKAIDAAIVAQVHALTFVVLPLPSQWYVSLRIYSSCDQYYLLELLPAVFLHCLQ